MREQYPLFEQAHSRVGTGTRGQGAGWEQSFLPRAAGKFESGTWPSVSNDLLPS